MNPQSPAVHRFEVRPSARAGDPLGASVVRAARSLGVEPKAVRTARVYLIEAPLDRAAVERVRTRLLADPVLEECAVGAGPSLPGERTIEVHPLPGVMDPAAQTVRDAVRQLTGAHAEVSTGTRYDIEGVSERGAQTLARRLLSNAVIEKVHHEPWAPARFPRATPADQTVRRVPLRDLSDEQLMKLSRDGHLFLSLAEMQTVRAHYQCQGREPTDVELETIAQTWSEHCVHKTLKSTVRYRAQGGSRADDPIRWEGRPGVAVGPDGAVTIRNLLKSTVAAATHELMADGLDWALSVFVDNAGVIAFDERHAVNIKVETHNRPSAIEPYGGAATGIGGCIRDVIGTGLGARPVASTDVFCVASPDSFSVESERGGPGNAKPLPPGVLHPRRVLSRVIDGVRDYGNRMGIPTLNGAVYFDDRYVGNPLVFCGCIGLMDRGKIRGETRAGDRIVALGGRTGKDGIHGATFSSAELTHTHADEFAHAVQIGNAIEEKRLLDAILRARDAGGPGRALFSALTDCGAGGFSSAVGEMARELGAEVHLDRAPLKYGALRYDEIWISESQERMVLSVPPQNMAALRAICEEEGVELADLGEFGTPTREIILRFAGAEVGRLDTKFLHEGIPMPLREAVWSPGPRSAGADTPHAPQVGAAPHSDEKEAVRRTLLGLLANPNIASKRWIVRQYDHEVQGNTVLKPLVGAGGVGPGDASVIQPVAGSRTGLAIACGLATPVGDPALGGDPYLMALAAIDECVRNLVCVGADPARIAILDNFCWPSCDKPANMAALVRAAVGCYDGAKAYRTPFVSGKDSLSNQFRYTDPATGQEVLIEIPPTLLITGIGLVRDVAACVTMDLKPVAGSVLVLVEGGHRRADLGTAVQTAHALHGLISAGKILAAHDSSEGGPLVAMAEMLLAGDQGWGLSVSGPSSGEPAPAHFFRERIACYALQCEQARASEVIAACQAAGAAVHIAATVTRSGLLSIGTAQGSTDVPFADLRRAFLGTLDW
ncbi:MAG: phosphoribosylformylglycinamidine synthase subunit PurS [Planctomycetota bacterium]|nr:phosphoribosylformylglycinamidine synthase subunit PurS [Planctomycetota bacterium]